MKPENSIKVLCVDDHPILREGIASIFQTSNFVELVAQAESGKEALQLFDKHRPDVTLVDLRLPDMSGIELIVAIREHNHNAKIVVLTTEAGDILVRRSLAAGAQGYVLKGMPMEDLIDAIRKVHAGQNAIPGDVAINLVEHLSDENLSMREQEVLQLVAKGLRNKQVAWALGIGEQTVKMHVKNILMKLGASDRTHAVTISLQRGIISLE